MVEPVWFVMQSISGIKSDKSDGGAIFVNALFDYVVI